MDRMIFTHKTIQPSQDIQEYPLNYTCGGVIEISSKTGEGCMEQKGSYNIFRINKNFNKYGVQK